jgi:hypothetical protein
MNAAGNTPDILTPKAIQGAYDNLGWMGRNVVGPLAQGANAVVSPVVREVARLGAGGTAAASEIIGGGDPEKARDVNALAQILPVVTYGMPYVPPDLMTRSPSVDTTGPFPKATVDIRTPADAAKVVTDLYRRADSSDFTLKPQFTQDFVSGLDKYQPQTPAGAASASSTHPVASLIADLKKTASAPMDSIASIQDVDQNIQKAISQNLGDPDTVRQMRAILRDFRDRYTNIPPDQYTGSPQGIVDFNNARQGYAAQSRMNEVQGIVDSTQGNPNRATLISSRINGFLNDTDNTAGWTPDEIASLRKAAATGFVPEWLRAGGSRLLAIGAGAAHGLIGGAGAMTADVAGSYMLRNTAENMRLRQIGEVQRLLGQRVPQPGTVPQAPTPSLLTSPALRYAPLTGLLAQPQPSQ